MGKGILIFVMASTISLATLYLARTEQDLATAQTEADYQEKIVAQQTAQSAFSIVISKVRQSFESGSFALKDQSYGGANYDIGAIRDADGSVTLIAVGKYGRHSFEIIGSMVMQGEEIDAALTIDGGIGSVVLKQDATISGDDANPEGENVDGITVTDPSLFSGDTDHIIGSVTGGDAGPLTAAMKEIILNHTGKVEYEGNQTWHTETNTDENIGSESSPEIIVVNGNVSLQGNFEGYGVLFVNGNLSMQQNARWKGIVFVTGANSQLSMQRDSRIDGVVFLDGINELDMKQDTFIQYDSSALEMLQPLLDALDSEGEAEVIRQVANTSYRDGQEMGNAYIDDSVVQARNLLN